jgi:hypothetical protein
VIFVHEDPEFRLLLELVSSRRGVDPGVVEKDYWVTHTLWALQAQGWAVWFKGGTSLSKGFSLIERFSEDLDLRLEPGPGLTLPEVSSWTKDGPSHVASRRAHLEALGHALVIPGTGTIAAETPPIGWSTLGRSRRGSAGCCGSMCSWRSATRG